MRPGDQGRWGRLLTRFCGTHSSASRPVSGSAQSAAPYADQATGLWGFRSRSSSSTASSVTTTSPCGWRSGPSSQWFCCPFEVGAGVFIGQGVIRRRLTFHWVPGSRVTTGSALIVFALVLSRSGRPSPAIPIRRRQRPVDQRPARPGADALRCTNDILLAPEGLSNRKDDGYWLQDNFSARPSIDLDVSHCAAA
jgi:hypothetical protein